MKLHGVIKETIGIQVSPEEYEQLEARAKLQGAKNLSRWARGVLLSELQPKKRQDRDRDGFAAGCRTWAEAWASLSELHAKQAGDGLRDLLRGKPLPVGFMQWTQDERIDWLERNCPL
jgi:hypothetical protein